MTWHYVTHCDMAYHDMAGECITPPTGSRPVHCPSPLLTILPRNFVELTFTRFSKEPDCSKIFSFSSMNRKIFKFLCQSQKEKKNNSTCMPFRYHKNSRLIFLERKNPFHIYAEYIKFCSLF